MGKLIGLDGQTAGNQGPSKANMSVNILDQETVKCLECDGVIFEQVIVLKKINKVLVGAPHDQIVPIQLFRCMDCGTVSGEGLPDPSMLEKILSNE